MTKEQLYEAMSLIDDKYIAESMTEYKPKMPKWIKHSIATAAVLVVCVGIALLTLGGGLGRKDAVNLDGNMSSGEVGGGQGNAPGNSETDDGLNNEAMPLIRIGDVVGSVTAVSAESYGDGILTLGLRNYSEGALDVIVLYRADGVASYSALGVDESAGGVSSVTGAREDRSELIGSHLDVQAGEGTLTVDLTDILAVAEGGYSIILFVDGAGYLLSVNG